VLAQMRGADEPSRRGDGTLGGARAASPAGASRGEPSRLGGR